MRALDALPNERSANAARWRCPLTLAPATSDANEDTNACLKIICAVCVRRHDACLITVCVDCFEIDGLFGAISSL